MAAASPSQGTTAAVGPPCTAPTREQQSSFSPFWMTVCGGIRIASVLRTTDP